MRAVILLLLSITSAAADTTVLFSTFGDNVAGPAPVTLMVSMFMNSDHNLTMMASAKDPVGIKSLTITGNGRALVTCQSDHCTYVWSRAAMRSGNNTVILQSYNTSNKLRETIGYISQPPAP